MSPETSEMTETVVNQQETKKSSVESMTPKRIISICRGIAQQSFACHNDNLTYRIAHRDNQMITDNCHKISDLYDKMEENFESEEDYDTIVKNNADMSSQVRAYRRDNILIKTTKVTSDNIRNRKQPNN